MKRLGSSDSLGALISIYPSTEEKISENNHVYSGGFQSMLDSLDEEDCGEESGQIGEKKRRLNVDQVKALEKNFEVENKLEPDRKVKLAQELGLQPRQVAVWFQNRRARWKTKQLERDYGLLKANYEDLKLKFDALKHDKESLLTELRELKSKLQEDNNRGEISVKEEILISESEEKAIMQNRISATEINDPNQECYSDINGGRNLGVFDFKDGSSDSDSSAILNDDTSPNAGICSSEILQEHHLLISPPSSSLRFNYCSSNNFLPFSDSRAISNNTQKGYQPQFVKMEEYDFFNAEEPCNFFSEDQGSTLQWYSPDQWT